MSTQNVNATALIRNVIRDRHIHLPVGADTYVTQVGEGLQIKVDAVVRNLQSEARRQGLPVSTVNEALTRAGLLVTVPDPIPAPRPVATPAPAPAAAPATEAGVLEKISTTLDTILSRLAR